MSASNVYTRTQSQEFYSDNMSTPLNDSFNWFILIFYKNAYTWCKTCQNSELQKIKKHFGSSRASQLWYMMGI